METYETQEMTKSEAYAFADWHSKTIGTEYEVNTTGYVENYNENYYVVGWDMLPIEIGLCRAWEQSHIPAPTDDDVKAGRVDVRGWVGGLL